MPDAADPREPGRRLTPEGVEKARREWEPWCRTLSSHPGVVAAALDAAIDYLGAGLEAETVAALLRIRSARSAGYELDRGILNWEVSHCERVRRELPALRDAGVVSAEDAKAIDAEYAARLDRLGTASTPLVAQPPVAAAAQTTAPAPASAALAPSPALAAPARPTAPPPSLRDLFAEHSVLILASFGAFLLVVATVLFELYGTVGLGGTGRFAAVITLDAIFALAGFFALRQPNLRAVGQIYTGLAAVLLPLVGLAAWTFLELGRQGITTDQAIGVTGLACALVYGGLAIRLRLRAYAEMSGVAIFAAAFGLAGAVAGEQWRPLGLAVTPFAYAACERYLRADVLSHFPWFAHATALVAVLLALNDSQPSGWLLTGTLTALAIAYLAWQAIAPHRSRAWTGEAALVLAAAAASGPLGVSTYHFVLPMLFGIPLALLARVPERLGAIGRLYRAAFRAASPRDRQRAPPRRRRERGGRELAARGRPLVRLRLLHDRLPARTRRVDRLCAAHGSSAGDRCDRPGAGIRALDRAAGRADARRLPRCLEDERRRAAAAPGLPLLLRRRGARRAEPRSA